MIRKVNPYLVRGELSREDAGLILDTLRRIDPVLAIFDFKAGVPALENPAIEALEREREEARERRDYAEADRIREELRKRNVTVEDTTNGTLYWVEGAVTSESET